MKILSGCVCGLGSLVSLVLGQDLALWVANCGDIVWDLPLDEMRDTFTVFNDGVNPNLIYAGSTYTVTHVTTATSMAAVTWSYVTEPNSQVYLTSPYDTAKCSTGTGVPESAGGQTHQGPAGASAAATDTGASEATGTASATGNTYVKDVYPSTDSGSNSGDSC